MSWADKFNLLNPVVLLRLICALFFIPHVVGKFTEPATLGFFKAAKFNPPATWMYVAGGLNLAALKKPNVAGSVNLPTTCGMKNSAQIRRRSTSGLSRLNLSAQDMRFPRCGVCGAFQMIATGRARVGRCPTIRACAIDPYCERGAGRCLFFLPLACARERSAGRRFGNKLTPRERRRVPYDRHARLPALHCGDFLHGL